MTEVAHIYGGDLYWSPSGDLLTASNTEEGRERVLRRILTIQGNYIWNTGYGGGAPALIGSVATADEVEAIMLAQMLLEEAVSQTPPPVVNVTTIPTGYAVTIQYTDAKVGDPVLLSFSLT